MNVSESNNSKRRSNLSTLQKFLGSREADSIDAASTKARAPESHRPSGLVLCNRALVFLEHETRFELATLTLARRCWG